jgi:hypothetical protein
MTAFVLGNGVSRQAVEVDTLMKLGKVYGCNGLYRTHTPTVLVATDRAIAQAIQDSGYPLKNRFYTRRPAANTGALSVPKAYFGFSSGPIAAAIAAQENTGEIYLLGFDLGPDSGKFNNVYAGTQFYKPVGALPTFTGNWIRQMITIMKDHSDRQFYRVTGQTTADVPEFASIPNLKNLAMHEFLVRINTRKDL